MKRSKLCYSISLLLALGFLLQTAIDYSRYNAAMNSAPFSLWVLVNALSFLVPALAVLVVRLILRKKGKLSLSPLTEKEISVMMLTCAIKSNHARSARTVAVLVLSTGGFLPCG